MGASVFRRKYGKLDFHRLGSAADFLRRTFFESEFIHANCPLRKKTLVLGNHAVYLGTVDDLCGRAVFAVGGFAAAEGPVYDGLGKGSGNLDTDCGWLRGVHEAVGLLCHCGIYSVPGSVSGADGDLSERRIGWCFKLCSEFVDKEWKRHDRKRIAGSVAAAAHKAGAGGNRPLFCAAGVDGSDVMQLEWLWRLCVASLHLSVFVLFGRGFCRDFLCGDQEKRFGRRRGALGI